MLAQRKIAANEASIRALQVREHSSAVKLCGPHVAISPAMLRCSNQASIRALQAQEQGARDIRVAAARAAIESSPIPVSR